MSHFVTTLQTKPKVEMMVLLPSYGPLVRGFLERHPTAPLENPTTPTPNPTATPARGKPT